MLKIPFFKPSITGAEITEVVDTLKGGWLTTGPKTKQFEQEFATFVRQRHAVALNSCTAALHLALEAVGLKAGEGVIVPTMTFAATAEVVRYFNANPLLVDCRLDDFNLDVVDAERRIESALAQGQKVAAIIPVHYGGQIGDVTGVAALAKRFNLKIIEDAAHCCPAYYREDHESEGRGHATHHRTPSPNEVKRAEANAAPHLALNSQLSTLDYAANGWSAVGTSADITCFSFYANKCITTGEGGMACTNSEEFAERMRIMSLHGISKDAWKRFTGEGSWYYEIVAPGFKYNMTDVAAAIGIHQLRKAEELLQKRCNIAALYTQLLEEVDELILAQERPNRIHSWHLYVIRLKLDRLRINRVEVIEALKQAGITTSVHWMPLHEHPYYRENYGYKPEDFPVAAGLYPQIITLPLYPDMKPEEVEYVCNTLKSILARNLKSTEAKGESKKQAA